MVISCAAANCSNRQGKASGGAVSFHRFPLKDSKRLIQWLKAVKRDNWKPTKYSFLCSEHFTKDSFSKRLEDQHRLLKPTAVPTIFQLAEEKRDDLGYVGHGGEIASPEPPRDGEDPRAGGCEVAQRTSSAGQDFMVMQGTKEMEEETLQAEIGSMSEEKESLRGQPGGSRRRTLGGKWVAKRRPQKKPKRSSVEESPKAAWVADRSGVSADDFTPPASGVCKFIGSLHSYSFSSKHPRPSFPKEQLERKRPKRDVGPSCSSQLMGHDKAEGSSTSSRTATPQKPSQGLSASPADLTPQPAAEAAVGQKGDTDANPMSINEVIMSASGACKLIDSLHSYCFSSRQSKNQVCCLREQVEKKNGELKLLRQRISRSDSQVRKLKEKLDELKRISFPYLNSLLS
ncbi:THAP4 protein, partial [Piaya cayana]|nr:THAP4 protein [Piaya cayana]